MGSSEKPCLGDPNSPRALNFDFPFNPRPDFEPPRFGRVAAITRVPPKMRFKLILGSVCGFIVMTDRNRSGRPVGAKIKIHLWNGMTGEFVTVTIPQNRVVFLFGNIGENYKLVMIRDGCFLIDFQVRKWNQFESVTKWKQIEIPGRYLYNSWNFGTFLNGKVYWMAYELDEQTPLISCLDLKTELFSVLQAPLPEVDPPTSDPLDISSDLKSIMMGIMAMDSSLYVYDYSAPSLIVIWNRNGEEWSRVCIINIDNSISNGYHLFEVRLIKVLEIGISLILNRNLYFYNNSGSVHKMSYYMFQDSRYRTHYYEYTVKFHFLTRV